MSKDREYKIVNGTYYDARTPDAVIDQLEYARRTNTRIILTYGDAETGRSWGDVYMTTGTIGRSTGSIKIPLLIANSRSTGGPGLLDSCIIRIRTAAGKRLIWKADNFQTPQVEIVPSDMEGYTHAVKFNGSIMCRERSLKSAQRIVSIIE